MSKSDKQTKSWYKDKWALIVIVLTMFIFYTAGTSSRNEATISTNTVQPQQQPQSKTDLAKSPDPIKLSGNGQKATDKFSLKAGLATFKISHNGAHHFSVKLLNSNGDYIDLLVNETGVFDGSKAEQITINGDYLLDISADGDWTVNIQQ